MEDKRLISVIDDFLCCSLMLRSFELGSINAAMNELSRFPHITDALSVIEEWRASGNAITLALADWIDRD